MTVYLDLVFVLNFAVNYLLLRGTAQLGGGLRGKRLLAGAALGAAYAAAVWLPGCGFLRLSVCKLVCAAGMLTVSFGLRRTTLRLAAVFGELTLALCGAVYGVELLKHGTLRVRGDALFFPVSFASVVLTAGAVCAACRLLLPKLNHAGKSIVPLTLRIGARSLHLSALRDTGCTLCDPVSGEAVLVAEWRAARALTGLPLQAAEFASPDALALRLRAFSPRLIPYRAVGTGAGMLVALPVQATLGKTTARRLVAFSPTPLSDSGAYEALIGGTNYAENHHGTACPPAA